MLSEWQLAMRPLTGTEMTWRYSWRIFRSSDSPGQFAPERNASVSSSDNFARLRILAMISSVERLSEIDLNA